MNPMLTAPHVSLEHQAPDRYELIISPDFDSTVGDMVNAAKAAQFIRRMIALGYSTYETRDASDASGRKIIRFKK